MKENISPQIRQYPKSGRINYMNAIFVTLAVQLTAFTSAWRYSPRIRGIRATFFTTCGMKDLLASDGWGCYGF